MAARLAGFEVGGVTLATFVGVAARAAIPGVLLPSMARQRSYVLYPVQGLVLLAAAALSTTSRRVRGRQRP